MPTEKQASIVVPPNVDVDVRLEQENVFASCFGHLSTDAWLDTLIASITTPSISGVDFPTFPSPAFQSQLHGHYGAHSLREASDFYRFVESRELTGPNAPWYGKGYMLDFGAGWGRITRLFIRDFPLRHIIGYEPSNRYCSVARATNPFVSFLSGDYLPSGILPSERFNLVVAWSVFSHLSQHSAGAWLHELERVLTPGGAIVITTWGLRFLQRLAHEKQQLEAGQDIHWYSKVCLHAIGDISSRISAFTSGQFVWFTGGGSTLYGEAFMSRPALEALLRIHAPTLIVADYNTDILPQDVFVLRRITQSYRQRSG